MPRNIGLDEAVRERSAQEVAEAHQREPQSDHSFVCALRAEVLVDQEHEDELARAKEARDEQAHHQQKLRDLREVVDQRDEAQRGCYRERVLQVGQLRVVGGAKHEVDVPEHPAEEPQAVGDA